MGFCVLEGVGPSEPTKRNYSTENAEGRETPRRKVESGERTKKREGDEERERERRRRSPGGALPARGDVLYTASRGGCAKRPHRIGLMQMCRAPPLRARGVFVPSVHRDALAGRTRHREKR